MLTDAGPLIALFDRNDPEHTACLSILRESRAALVSTWPAFTEAMFLLGERFRPARWNAQERLWSMLVTGGLELRNLTPTEILRAGELMQKYRDLPMDLADATLVASAESIDSATIFSLDRDFHVYRIHGRRAFDVIPRPPRHRRR